METKKIKRRDFLKNSAGAAGLIISLPVLGGFLASCEENESPLTPEGTVEVLLSDYPALQQPGGAVIANFEGSGDIIIIRNSETEFLAASAVCTHQGCTVNLPANESADINCPCHGAVYSRADASVIKYPTSEEKPLPVYSWDFNAGAGILTIDFSNQTV